MFDWRLFRQICWLSSLLNSCLKIQLHRLLSRKRSPLNLSWQERLASFLTWKVYVKAFDSHRARCHYRRLSGYTNLLQRVEVHSACQGQEQRQFYRFDHQISVFKLLFLLELFLIDRHRFGHFWKPKYDYKSLKKVCLLHQLCQYLLSSWYYWFQTTRTARSLNLQPKPMSTDDQYPGYAWIRQP